MMMLKTNNRLDKRSATTSGDRQPKSEIFYDRHSIGHRTRSRQKGKTSEHVSKRSRSSCTHEKSRTNNCFLEHMPDEILSVIAEFVVGHNGLYVEKPSTKKKNEYELYFDPWFGIDIDHHDDVKNMKESMQLATTPSSKTFFSLRGIATLLRIFAPLSLRMKEFISEFLNQSLVDANFFDLDKSQWLECIAWMRKNNSDLSSLTINVMPSEANLLATFLQDCRTRELRSFEVKVHKTEINVDSMLAAAVEKQCSTDLERSLLNSMSQDSVIMPSTVIFTQNDLYKVVAEECPRIEILKVCLNLENGELKHSLSLFSYFPSLLSIKSLKYLDLEVSFRNKNNNDVATYNGDAWDGETLDIQLGTFTKLKGLILNVGLRGTGGPKRSCCHVYSDSLELIDTSCSGNLFFVTECKCPQLKFFICGGFGGLIQEEDDDDNDDDSPSYPQHDVMIHHHDEDESSIMVSQGFQGLEAPTDCAVIIKDCF